jgi:hypothetical protein
MPYRRSSTRISVRLEMSEAITEELWTTKHNRTLQKQTDERMEENSFTESNLKYDPRGKWNL